MKARSGPVTRLVITYAVATIDRFLRMGNTVLEMSMYPSSKVMSTGLSGRGVPPFSAS